MPTTPDMLYLEAEDYQDQTKAPTLVSPLSGEEVDEILLEAMTLIDAYIGDGWTPFDDEQEFIFPREQDEDSDGNAEIPRPIAIATRMIADAILLRRQKGVLPHEVASESNLGHSYQKHTRSAEPDPGFEWVPPDALALLQKYRRVGGCFAVSSDE